MSTLSFQDTLKSLRANDLKRSPSVGGEAAGGRRMLARAANGGVPENAEILEGMREFYGKNKALIDTTTNETSTGVQKRPDYVRQMNSFDWERQKLTKDEEKTAFAGLYGDDGGIWDDTLNKVKATDLFTTVGVGVNAEFQLILGGQGGIGVAFDIAKRESAKGYVLLVGQIGLRVSASANLQVTMLNLLPSQLDVPIYGLTVSIHAGVGISFSVIMRPPGLTVLGYSIGAGAGVGVGATVFGGKLWSFG